MNQTDNAEANKALVMRLIQEGFNKGDLSIVDEVVAPNMREYQRGNHDGTEGTKEVIQTLHRWFPDFNMQMQDMIAEGDAVWVRFSATGTNLGSVMRKPPTGKKIRVDVIDIVKIKDGKIVEHWGVPDQLGMMLQLGLLGNQ